MVSACLTRFPLNLQRLFGRRNSGHIRRRYCLGELHPSLRRGQRGPPLQSTPDGSRRATSAGHDCLQTSGSRASSLVTAISSRAPAPPALRPWPRTRVPRPGLDDLLLIAPSADFLARLGIAEGDAVAVLAVGNSSEGLWPSQKTRSSSHASRCTPAQRALKSSDERCGPDRC